MAIASGDGIAMNLPFRNVLRFLALTTCASLILYGLAAVTQAPPTGPDGFIPDSLQSAPQATSRLAQFSPVLVVIYALSFLPVVVLFTIATFRTQPVGVIVGSCLVVISLLIEVVNALPLSGLMFAPPRTAGLDPNVVLFLMQTDAVRFLALDVAGFSLAYAGLVVFAVAFVHTHPWLTRTIVASTLLFAANVPFLWIQPGVAVILMVASILVFAAIPLLIARIALRELCGA